MIERGRHHKPKPIPVAAADPGFGVRGGRI